MAFSGAFQIFTIASASLVNRVADWQSLANSINSALASLGPAWALTRNVPSTQNLNTFKVPGMHRITTTDTATIVNLPPGMRTAGVFENLISGDGTDTWWAQRVTEYGVNPRTWWRVSADTVGNFNPWALEGTQATKITEWHVFLAVGQSNMSGRGSVGVSDGGRYCQMRIAQFGYTRRVLETATVPLDMHDTATGLSPATTFAQAYLKSQPNHVGVLIVPAAHGSTGFTTTANTLTWTPGAASSSAYDLPLSAVTQTNDALAAVTASGAAGVLKGILWHQGENNSTMSTATYASNLDALISYFRTQFNNPTLPFMVGQMTPEGIAATSGRINVDTAHRQTPQRVAYTGFAASRSNGYNTGDTTHMNQDGVDFLGRNYVDAYEDATENPETPITWEESPYMGRWAHAFDRATGAEQTLYSDSGWRDVTSWFPTLTSGNVYARRFGSTISLDFQGAAFSDPAGTVTAAASGTVPGYFRPARNATLTVWGTTSGAARRLLVTAGGTINIYNTVTPDNYWGTVTYLASGGTTVVALPGTQANAPVN